MQDESVMTSKGTITITAPFRKALGLKPGQKVKLRLDRRNNSIVLGASKTLEQVEAMRDEILSRHPDRPKGLSLKQMRDRASKKWLAELIAEQK